METEPPSQEEAPSVTESPGKFLMWLFRQAYRVAVIVIGFTILLIGVIMIVAPGPALIVIPIGLGILAQEFVWARKWLDYAKRQLEEFGITSKSEKTQDPPPGDS